MSLSPITPTPTYTPETTQNFQQRRSEFQQLSQALQSGDLTSAQSAYNLLSQNASSSQINPNNPLAQDFAAIGKALQSGDVQGAQTAFQKMQQDAKEQFGSQGGVHRGGGHHHHHHSSTDATQTDPTQTNSTDPTATVGTNVDVTA